MAAGDQDDGQGKTAASPPSARQRFDWTLDPPTDGSFKPVDPYLNLRDGVRDPSSADHGSLSDFRESEGRLNRLARLKSLFENLSPSAGPGAGPSTPPTVLGEKEEELRKQRQEARQAYAGELWVACGGKRGDAAAQKRPEWTKFAEFAEKKEAELWQVFHDIDRDNNGRLNEQELHDAVSRAGIDVSPDVIRSFLLAVDKNRDGTICFEEWRDFLLLLPRPAGLQEIFRYYSARTPTRFAASQVTQDGDVTMGASGSGWARGKRGLATELGLHVGASTAPAATGPAGDLREEPMKGQGAVMLSSKAEGKRKVVDLHDEPAGAEEDPSDEKNAEDAEQEGHGESRPWEGAGKFLLAGGIAGAVSRSATAPFDRLKIYLINDDSPSFRAGEAGQQGKSAVDEAVKGLKQANPAKAVGATAEATKRGTLNLASAVRAIYIEGGVRGFFVGNGLNVVKIFPESACKFLVYELCKRAFAKYVDDVPDQSQISGASRFISGGVGGVASQFAIYPVETLKTRVMSSTSSKLAGNELLVKTARDMWAQGRTKAYYRGLVPALIGVFPYSAIDMSAFEALKQAWVTTLGDEPGVLGTLLCGAFSGGVGATTVYPLNLIRTRLQSQGSPSHPQRYDGIMDCARKTYRNEGLRSLYKGLSPSLLKVVPAMSLSWLVYDNTTRILNVGS